MENKFYLKDYTGTDGGFYEDTFRAAYSTMEKEKLVEILLDFERNARRYEGYIIGQNERIAAKDSYIEKQRKEAQENDGNYIVSTIVEDTVKEIISDIKNGNIDDDDGVRSAIDNAADNACIYTSDCWAIAKVADTDSLDSGLWEGTDDVDKMITGIAYAHVQQEIWNGFYDAVEDELGLDSKYDYEKVLGTYEKCIECGEYFSTELDDEHIETDNGFICGECKEAEYTECSNCGEWFKNGDLQEGLCAECIKDFEVEEEDFEPTESEVVEGEGVEE